MKDRFGGAVAIVTGGASGIGKALSIELVRRGAEVVIADRQMGVAEEVASSIRRDGGRAVASELDVRDFEAFDRLVEGVVASSGRVDFLFNNAGIGVGGEMADYKLEDWNDVFDVNLRGVANGVQAVYPRMVRQRSGHIVNTASLAGLVPGAFEGSYGASKHAVVGLTKALRVEGRHHGVRASVLCPGAIRTPILTGGVFGRMNLKLSSEALLRVWERTRPMDPMLFASAALDRIADDQAIIVLPVWWKALWYLERASPSASLALAGWIMGRLRAELGAERSRP